MTSPDALTGWRVLIPRGGDWGLTVATSLRQHGAIPVVAPLIEFVPPLDPGPLDTAFERLEAGEFDWVAVTSATTVAEFTRRKAVIPAGTRVAAVGDSTAAQLTSAGYPVDFVPETDHSARGLIAGWPDSARPQNDGSAGPKRILIPQSNLAGPSLATGLRALGFDVETVSAYRNVQVTVDARTVSDVRSGRINALLLTSGSIARQVRDQFQSMPESTCIACIGEFTAAEARAVGLRIDVIAREHTATSLIDALADYAATDRSAALSTTHIPDHKESRHV